MVLRARNRTSITKQSGYTTQIDEIIMMVKELVDIEVAAAMSVATSVSSNTSTQSNTTQHENNQSDSIRNNSELLAQNSSSILGLQNSLIVVDASMNSLTDEIQVLKTNVATLDEVSSSLSSETAATSHSIETVRQSLDVMEETIADHTKNTDEKIETEVAALPNWTGRLFKKMHPYCTSVWANVGGSDVPSWIGSGCWINPTGLFNESPRHGFLLTAAHVIEEASNITSIWVLPPPDSKKWINLPLRRTTTNAGTKNVFEDVTTDIAIVKLNEVITQQYDPSGDALYPALHQAGAIVSEETTSTGDPVCMIGNPAGIDADSFSFGHIRDAHYLPPIGSYECIAHHTSSTGGNSGSPLFNVKHEIVGMLTHGNPNANEFFYGPNWLTLRRVIGYLFLPSDKQSTTLYGKGYRLEPNVFKTYPNEAVAFLNGDAQSIRIMPSDGISPSPSWSSAYVSSAVVHGIDGAVMFEIQIGDQQGGRGIGTLQFIENVSHIVFHGAFLSPAGQSTTWTFPNEVSILPIN